MAQKHRAGSARKRAVFSTRIGGMPITLHQTGRNSFTVTYWKQVEKGLSYGAAASALGSNIMHAAATEGKLVHPDDYDDNE